MLLMFTFAPDTYRDKFEYVYKKYKNLMLKKAYDVLRDPTLAEDAVSEAFIRIYKNLDKIEDPDSGRCIAFVAMIVRNTALTILASHKKQITGDDISEETQEDGFDLEGHVISGICASSIFGQIDELSHELRSVFILKFGHDLSHRDIGNMLGISENNVTVRLHRAKKKLAAILKEGGHIHE